MVAYFGQLGLPVLIEGDTPVHKRLRHLRLDLRIRRILETRHPVAVYAPLFLVAIQVA